jgi:GH24 family phage-related lysozyme (muramidase)
MAQSDLPLGQINPAARPVSDFVRPAQIQLAAPVAPPGMPALPGATLLQGPGMASIGGVNRSQQLAEALAPFSKNLTAVLQQGAESAAASAAQRGQRQAYAEARNASLQALSTADRTNEAASYDYAAANRKLAAKDPEGGFLMDLLNPYRQMGVQRGLSKLAGMEVEAAMDTAYGQNSAAILEAGDKGPAMLKRLQAQVTAQLTQKYALDETTPGFLNHTLPKINAATEKVSNKALKARVEYQKGYLPPVAAALISALWGDFKAQRLRKDPQLIIGNQTINNDDTPESRKAIDAALYSQAEAILDSHSAQMGLTGEPTYLGKKVAEILFANADANSVEDPQFKKFVQGIRTGPAIVVNPATGEKERMTLGALYSQESVDSEMKYGAYAFQQQQREQQRQIETAQDLALDGRPASPGRPELPSLLRTPFNDPAAQQALVEEHYKAWQLEHPGGSKTKFLEALNKVRGIVKDIPGYDYPANGVADLFNDMRGRYGDDWDPKQAAREYNEFRQTQINPKDLGAADREFDNLRRQKNSENGTLFRGTVNRIVQDEVTAALNREYGTGDEASISGMGMVALKAASANRAAARANLNKALYPYVNAAINAAAAKEKASLSEAQTMQIAQDAVRQYGTLSETSKAAYKTLFPGGRVSGAPSVPGTMATPAGPAATGKPVQAAPATYGVQQLDNFPKRQQRLLNWQNETILNREGIQTELMRLQAGQGFSPQLKRAAMDGRARTPAEFLEGQMKRYGMTITPRAMKHFQEISSAETTPLRYVSTLANAVYPSVARASRWALDAITGTQPSIAAEMPAGGAPMRPQRLIAFNPYRRPAASYGGGSGMGGSVQQQAMQLIRQFEGFRTGAYWDVNAYRAGYGSDTTTDVSGRISRVSQSTRVTKQMAERDLLRRSSEFLSVAQRQVGSRFSALNSATKAALASVTYNYGSLPATVVAAARTGDIRRISNAIKALQHDDNGINASRRIQEAAIVRQSITGGN